MKFSDKQRTVSCCFKQKNTPNINLTGVSDSDEEKPTELSSNTESQLTSAPASAPASKYMCCTIIAFFYLACSFFSIKAEEDLSMPMLFATTLLQLSKSVS